MATPSKTLVWIVDPALKGKVAHWVKAFESSGFRNKIVPFGKTREMADFTWIDQNLPDTTRAIFWLGSWDSGIRGFVPFLRKMRSANSSAPVLWVLPPGEETALTDATSGFVDDFLSLEDSPAVVLARLALRTRTALDRESTQQKLEEQAKSLARNETIVRQREEFLSVCAHDLRSPLGLIKSSISMILGNESNLTDLQRELLDRSKRQSGHALTLVGDLLDVMSYEQGLKPHYTQFGLEEFLGQIGKDYSFQAKERGLDFHFENEVGDWRILADSERVRQVLQNLLGNALKFTDSGKSITLKVSPFIGRRKSDPPYPMVVISVRDEGRGIPPREMQKIFDRFSQIKDYSRAEGRGLGLTVAKQISTLHDGNIWVESKEGKGANFKVLFPHVLGEVISTKVNPKRIIVAESLLDRRETFFDQIEDWGFDLVYAKDGAHAVALSHYERPAMLLLNDHISKMDPDEVVEMLKKDALLSDIPVVLCRDGSVPLEPDSQNVLFDGVVALPFTKAVFKEVLENRGTPPLKKKNVA